MSMPYLVILLNKFKGPKTNTNKKNFNRNISYISAISKNK